MKNKGGRPKEKPSDKVDYQQVERLAELGLIDEEIAYAVGYTKRTIDNWKKDEEFLTLLKRGKEKADSKVIKSLYERATGYSHKDVQMFCYQGIIVSKQYDRIYPPDPTSMIFWLKNRQPTKWRDKQDLELSGAVKTVSETTIFSLKPKG